MDAEEDEYFEESEESMYMDGRRPSETLETGKETSKQKKSKRKEAKEKKYLKKNIKNQGGSVCGTGQDKACCTIF